MVLTLKYFRVTQCNTLLKPLFPVGICDVIAKYFTAVFNKFSLLMKLSASKHTPDGFKLVFAVSFVSLTGAAVENSFFMCTTYSCIHA